MFHGSVLNKEITVYNVNTSSTPLGFTLFSLDKSIMSGRHCPFDLDTPIILIHHHNIRVPKGSIPSGEDYDGHMFNYFTVSSYYLALASTSFECYMPFCCIGTQCETTTITIMIGCGCKGVHKSIIFRLMEHCGVKMLS